MIETTRTWVRPSVDVPFHRQQVTEEFKAYFRNTYDITGKRISIQHIYSEDRLSLTIKGVWRDRAAYEEHLADPMINSMFSEREAYDISNGITSSDTAVVEI